MKNKKFAALGKGFSGALDTLEEAQNIIKKNGNGAVYVDISVLEQIKNQVRLVREKYDLLEDVAQDIDEIFNIIRVWKSGN